MPSDIRKSVYIGYDPREVDAFEVTRHSLLRHMREPIPVHKLSLDDVVQRGLYQRPTVRVGQRLFDELSAREDYDGSISTEHAISRFLVPHLAGNGWALFMDGDMLVRGDISEMFSRLSTTYAVYCVKHRHSPVAGQKMDGQLQTQYARKNWSSFMVFNCDHPANQDLTLNVINKWPGRNLHAFLWLPDYLIGELQPEWNYLVGYTKLSLTEPKVIHFTEGLPDMPGYEHCEYADAWRKELAQIKTAVSPSVIDIDLDVAD